MHTSGFLTLSISKMGSHLRHSFSSSTFPGLFSDPVANKTESQEKYIIGNKVLSELQSNEF